VPNYVLDFPDAVSAFVGDRSIASRVLRDFLQSVRSKIPGMAEALVTGDFKSLALEAHGIKGGALNLSAKELGQAAAELEHSAKTADLEGSRRLFEGFTQGFARLSEYAEKEGFASPETAPDA
jgi:HPt (histidine-containing phosphotransfer) domain-containing protein